MTSSSTSGRKSRKIGAPEPIAALNKVRILELDKPWTEREPLVDVRIHCPDVVLSPHLCPYLRRTVADMLNRAQASLPPGYKLRVGTCLRTLDMQKGGWDSFFKRMQEEHPNWPLSALRRATNKYFAPYDQKAPPGHCTGGAVDVGLLGPDGNPLDMIAPTKGWEAAYTWSDKIGPEAKRNRMMMVEAMLNAGFSNCRDEFWHYSWGDSAWAVRVGKTECPYGWAYPPVALETDFSGKDLRIDKAQAANPLVEMERDWHGRPLHARGRFDILPPNRDEVRLFAIGLYWAKGVDVELEACLPEEIKRSFPIFVGDGKESWEPLETWERQGNRLRIWLCPKADRVYLTDYPPPPKEPDRPPPDTPA